MPCHAMVCPIHALSQRVSNNAGRRVNFLMKMRIRKAHAILRNNL